MAIARIAISMKGSGHKVLSGLYTIQQDVMVNMKKPMLIGHRGIRGRLENTLPAFRRAVQYADGIEFDIRSTEDGRLVVHHDPVFHSNGRGYQIRELTLLEIRRLHPNGKIIPTVKEIFRRFPRMFLDADIKETSAVEPALRIAEITKSTERTVFSSENPEIAKRLLKECPDCKVGFSIVGYSSSLRLPRIKGLYSVHVPIDAVSYIGYHQLAVLLKTLRKRGLRIYLWNYKMDELYWVPRLFQLVDAVISDNPARLRKVFTGSWGMR